MGDDVLTAVLELVSSSPWLLAIPPVAFIVLQLTVFKKRDERHRRNTDLSRAEKRAVRDAHDELVRRAND